MSRARALLLVLLVFAAQANSSWVTIGETSRDCSLCSRIGFYDRTEFYAFLVTAGLAVYELNANGKTELQILRKEFDTMLDILPNKAELFEVTMMKFDIENASQGIAQRPNQRGYYSVLRIGIKNDGYATSISKMMKKGTFAPPALNSLSSMQRSFLRNSRRMITDTIINNQEVYDEATNESNKKDTAASDTTRTSPEKSTTGHPLQIVSVILFEEVTIKMSTIKMSLFCYIQ